MDVKVSKEVKAITVGVPIFDVVAIVILLIIDKLFNSSYLEQPPIIKISKKDKIKYIFFFI